MLIHSLAILIAGLGCSGLFGWILAWLRADNTLSRTLTNSYFMSPVSSLALVIVAFSVVSAGKSRHRARRLAIAGSIALATLVALRLLEFISGEPLVIQSVLDLLPDVTGGPNDPRNMSLSAMSAFICAASAILLLAIERGHAWQRVSAFVMSTAMCAIALAFLLGYIYNNPLVFSGQPIPVSYNTSFGLLLTGIALCSICRQRDERERESLIFELQSARSRLEASIRQRTNQLPNAMDRMREEIQQNTSMQQQLIHAQKLEVAGRLASGVAHDVNNFLTVINGYVYLAEDAAKADPTLLAYLKGVRDAAQRASRLTWRLLAFARQRIFNRVPVDMDALVNDTTTLLRPLLGGQIKLMTKRAPVWPVEADPVQIEQVVLNLAANAKDAMPTGGQLDVEVANATITEPLLMRHDVVEPGDYVKLDIRDTGTGISPQHQERLFEPFFTTKAEGNGTGLGLSTSLGIVKHHGGHLVVNSTPGVGSCFTLLLPKARQVFASQTTEITPMNKNPDEQPAPSAKPGHPPRTASAKPPLILIIDDDSHVLTIVSSLLARENYRTLTTTSAAEAVELAERHQDELDIVISDVIMPGAEPASRVDAIRNVCPRAAFLFMTVYYDDMAQGFLRSLPPDSVLHKPFSREQLLTAVQHALARTAR